LFGSSALRVGIPSGPVTAGVLRGQKSRFQLFGDTVNTTARIENNGIAGRIQVSEETAAELRKYGKADWLELRLDKVSAKGKGLLTTYFVNPMKAGTIHASSSGFERHDDSYVDEFGSVHA